MIPALTAYQRKLLIFLSVATFFEGYDFLALAQSPRLRDAAIQALKRGVPLGAGGSRLLRGNHPEHEALEEEAASLFGSETALYFSTGFAANGPMLPRPNTAVPFVTTATRLARAVSVSTSRGSATMASQAAATPGEYASARSRCVAIALVGMTEIFPGGCRR